MKSTNEFLTDISDLGENVFQEAYSDRTYKRQYILFGFSLITILFSFSMLTLDSFSFLGMKFNPSNIPLIKYIFSGCTGYALLVYWISVYKDLSLFQFKKMKAYKVIQSLNAETVESYNQKTRMINEIWEKQASVLESHNSFQAEMDLINETYNKEYGLLSDKMHQTLKDKRYDDYSSLFEKIEDLKCQYEEKIEPYKELEKEIWDNNIIEQYNQEVLSINYNEENSRSTSLQSVLLKYKVTTRLTFILELLIPSLLGVFAVTTAIFNLL